MSDDATIRAKKSIRSALFLAGFVLVGSLTLTIAHKVFGLIDSETTTRGVMVIIGLMLAIIGNSMPKKQEGPPPQTVSEISTRQSITRVGGWAMLLGGLVWAGLWAFAPRDIAPIGGSAAVGTAVIVMLVYAIWRLRTRSHSSAN